jgi:hypothetical protein
MLHLMFRAFISTGVADFSASLAKNAGEFTASRHVTGSQAADLRAVHVQGNAARHRLDISLLQAGGCTIVAGVRAVIASFDTGFVLLLGHDVVL